MREFLTDFAVVFLVFFLVPLPLCLSEGVMPMVCVARGFFSATAFAAFGAGYFASERFVKQSLTVGVARRNLAVVAFAIYCLVIFLSVLASCAFCDVRSRECAMRGACDLDPTCLAMATFFAGGFALIVGVRVFGPSDR